jgi:hypothetical protein
LPVHASVRWPDQLISFFIPPLATAGSPNDRSSAIHAVKSVRRLVVSSLFVSTVIGAMGATARAGGRLLFLDPGAVREAKGVMLSVNPPHASHPVIRVDRPWEGKMI